MGSTIMRPPYERYERAARWTAHIGGGVAFVAAFGSLYLMCGAVAVGFDPRQALLIDVSAFVFGLGFLALGRIWRNAIVRLNTCTSVTCNFARKVPAAETQMARVPKRPGHLVADVGLAVPV